MKQQTTTATTSTPRDKGAALRMLHARICAVAAFIHVYTRSCVFIAAFIHEPRKICGTSVKIIQLNEYIMDVGMHHAKNRGNKEIPLAILSRILAQSCVTLPT